MSEEKPKQGSFPYKYVLMGIALLAVIGLSFAVLMKTGASECEAIFSQTAPHLEANLEIIESKGAFAIGHEKIQELSDGATKVGLHLKTCCIASSSGQLKDGQFQQCLDKASSYDQKVSLVVQQVTEVVEAKAKGVANGVEEKVANINRVIDTATAEANTLALQVSQIKPAAAPKPAPAPSVAAAPKISKGQESEPNNVAAQATELSLNGEAEGEVTAKDDPDYFKLLPVKDLRDRVVVKLVNYSESLRPSIVIYNQKKSKMGEAYDYTYGADVEYAFTAELGTPYYVKVSPWDSTGKYKLMTRYQNAHDAFEPNDSAASATPISPGQTVQANVMDAQDADWYKLAAAPGASVQVQLKNRSTTLRPSVYIYNENKSKILDKYDYTYGASLTFSFDATAGKTYYLKVSPWDSNGAYELTLK